MKRLYLLVSMCVLALAGCGGGFSDLEEYVSQEKAQPKMPAKKVPDSPDYTPTPFVPGLSDPFYPNKSVMMSAPAVNSVGTPPQKESRGTEALEAYGLDQLKMIGVVNGGKKGKVALVQAPDRRVHMVSVGEHMGQNNGKVVKIEDDGLILKEMFFENKKWEMREATIKTGR
jgi:type IV pilus assembly protein PilP